MLRAKVKRVIQPICIRALSLGREEATTGLDNSSLQKSMITGNIGVLQSYSVCYRSTSQTHYLRPR